MDKFNAKLYHWVRYDSDRGTKLVDAKGNTTTLKKGDLFGVYELNKTTDYILVQKFPTVVFRNPVASTDKLYYKSKQYKGKPPVLEIEKPVKKTAPAVKPKAKPGASKKINIKVTPLPFIKPTGSREKILVQLTPKPIKHQDQEDMLDAKTDTEADLWGSRKISDPGELDYDDEIPGDVYHSYRDSLSSATGRIKRKTFTDPL